MKTKAVYSQKSRSKEDDSRPYKHKTRGLSPAEALRAVQLEQLLLSQSTDVSQYLEMRASLSSSLLERRAWRILWALLRFVEGNQRFPRYKEQILLIGSVLSGKGYQFPATSLLQIMERKDVEKLIRELRRTK